MNTTIAIYYINELTNWRDAIDLHLEAIGEADEWLKEVIQSDTVPNLAALVEHHMNQLMVCRQKFEDIHADAQAMESKLLKDDIPVDSEILTPGIRKEQNELRINMYQAEKDFLEVKHGCDVFLEETVHIQNKTRDGKN